MMRQEVISILALVLTKFHCSSIHDTDCKYWNSPSIPFSGRFLTNEIQFDTN